MTVPGIAFSKPVMCRCMHDGGRLRHSLVAFPDKTSCGAAERQASCERAQEAEY